MKIYILYFFLSIFLISTAYAETPPPHLNFSDITSGPKTGLGDGLGSGAIVTIWGNNLGSTQGTSTVQVGSTPAAHVYEWTNATVHKGHPAELYEYHKMQVIMFSIPAGAQDGKTTITVTVNGVTSNALPFTVRPGNIYHVKTTGSDSGTGSYSNPWATMYYAVNDGMTAPGDITYVHDGVESIDDYALVLRGDKSGTSELPKALIAFPLSDAYVTSNSPTQGGVANANHTNEFWTFSKLDVHGAKPCFSTGREWRVVASSCTDPIGECGNLSGQGGAMGGGAAPTGWPEQATSGMKFLGNYVHDLGCETANSTKMQHTFYMSVRDGVQAEKGIELGWNYLRDNKNNFGLHFYDEGYCGGWGTPNSIHDNVVVNQNGSGMDYNLDCNVGHEVTTPMYMYNNLLINVGNNFNYSDGPTTTAAIVVGKTARAQGDVYLYNNTIYGYGSSVVSSSSNGALYFATAFGGTLDYRNNIVVDTKGFPYTQDSFQPSPSTNNLFYGNPNGAPAWATNAITANPLLTNPAGGDYTLQAGSPARNAGTNLSSVLTTDLLGSARTSFDIGAFGYYSPKPMILDVILK